MKQITADRLTKRYKKYVKAYHVIPEKLRLMRKVDTITALDNVSFEMDKGESLTLVGGNGAGKTTLLKILLGITRQTSGSCAVDGNFVAMLQIGLGMHDLLPGDYNIRLFGNILGMSDREIDRKFDDIVAFAQLEKLLHMPIRAYSRGMRVRLAFSVMMHVETDGYVIDETLAFSDLSFRRLCVEKLKEHRRNGASIIMASHDLDLVRELSDRVMWIRDGRVCEDGPAAAVLKKYEDSHDYSIVTGKQGEWPES